MSTQKVTNSEQLRVALSNIFEIDYGKVIAIRISNEFLEYCDENGLDWDLLVEEFEIDDINDSLLIDAIVEVLNNLNINYEQSDKEKLYELLKNIKPIHSNINDIIQCDKDNIKLNNYKDKIYKLFQAKYNKKDSAKQAIEAFERFIDEEEFEFDGLIEDISDNTESLIVSAMSNYLDFAETNDILIILKEALNDKISIPFNPSKLILNINDNEKEMARSQFREFCPTIFQNEENNKNKISDLAILKAIDIKNGNHSLILLLWDTWNRYKIDNNIENLDISSFWDKHYKYAKYLNIKYKNNQKIYHLLQNIKMGLQTFNKRIITNNNNLNINNNNYIICDNFNQFVIYTISTSQFIQYIIQQKQLLILPQLIEFWIIPQRTKINNDIIYDDDDDDDDDDEIKHDDNNNNDNYCYLGYGGIDDFSKSPINPIGDISQYLKKCKYREGIDFVSIKLNDNISTINMMRSKFLNLYKEINKKNVSHQRFIFIVDRRNPKYYLHPSSTSKSSTLDIEEEEEEEKENKDCFNYNNKSWNDTIYCIKPKQDKVCEIISNYWQFPEIFLELSRKFILPTTNKNQYIGIINSLFGYLFTLSYHLYDTDISRCYWSQNGKIQRFFSNDIIKLWPKYFIPSNHGKLQKFDYHSLDLFKPLKDDKFKLFYQETINGFT